MSISDEIRASAAAHRDLGPTYDTAVAEGLVERIGEEIDRRIDIRMGATAATSEAASVAASAAAVNAAVASLAAARGRRARSRALAALAIAQSGVAAAPAQVKVVDGSSRLGFAHVVLALGSMLVGIAATGILGNSSSSVHPAGPLIAFAWICITVINVAYVRRR